MAADLPPDFELARLLWVFCEALYTLNEGGEIATAQRLFLKVQAKRLLDRLEAHGDK